MRERNLPTGQMCCECLDNVDLYPAPEQGAEAHKANTRHAATATRDRVLAERLEDVPIFRHLLNRLIESDERRRQVELNSDHKRFFWSGIGPY